MINRNTLLIENHRFLLEFKSNKRRYMDFLKTMAKYHKYSVPQQMNLFFHAPAIYQPAETALPIPVQEKTEHTRPYGIFYENGHLISYRAAGTQEPLHLTAQQERKILSAIHMREATYNLLEAERNGCSQAELAGLQASLNTLYEDHVSRYGRIQEDKELEKLFSQDPSYPLLRTLEVYDGKNFQKKADLFFKRTIRPDIAPTHADTAEDALKISMQERGRVDLSYMAGLTGDSTKDLIDSLEYTSIYYDEEKNEYQLADEYLSGDVRQKLAFLQQEREKLLEVMQQQTMEMLYPDWKEYAMNPQNDLEARFLAAAKEGRKILAYTLNSQDRDYIRSHQDDREAAAMFAGVMNSDEYVADRFREDPLFALQTMRYGKPLYRNEMPAERILLNLLKKLDVSEQAVVDMRRGAITRENAMVIGFLQERLGAYPQNNPEELEQFQNRLKEEWEVYQEEQRIAQENLRNDVSNGSLQSIQRRLKRIDKNIEALEAVKPKDLGADEIHASLGTTWIQPEYIEAFLKDTLSLSYREEKALSVQYSSVTGKWRINGKNVTGNAKVNKTYGTESINALNLCELALNLK